MTAFFDTNVIVYAVSTDQRQFRARETLGWGGHISVQVLNEMVNVLHGKLRLDWQVVENARAYVEELFPAPLPLTHALHQAAVLISRDHQIHIYDALIIAAALEARCDTLYSEDLQHGRRFGALSIVNPFR